jgi:hypothetical protein
VQLLSSHPQLPRAARPNSADSDLHSGSTFPWPARVELPNLEADHSTFGMDQVVDVVPDSERTCWEPNDREMFLLTSATKFTLKNKITLLNGLRVPEPS